MLNLHGQFMYEGIASWMQSNNDKKKLSKQKSNIYLLRLVQKSIGKKEPQYFSKNVFLKENVQYNIYLCVVWATNVVDINPINWIKVRKE